MNTRLQPNILRGLSDLSLKAFILALFAFLISFAPSGAQAQGASMRGFVYEDLNGNGIRDVGEPPKSGAQFFISRPGMESMLFTSNTQGFYGDQSLPGGEYLLGLPIDRTIVSRYEGGNPGAPIPINLRPGQHLELPNIGIEPRCFEISKVKILCDVQNPGCFIVTMDITNITNFPIGHMFFLQGPPVVVQAINPPSNAPNYIQFNPPIAPGATKTIKFRVCGAQPLTSICLDVSVHSPDMLECCLGRICLDLPDCDCFQIIDETWECNDDGTYTWCFTLQSLVPASVSPLVNWLTIVAPPGVTISQAVFPLNPPLAYGQSVQICVTVSGVLPNKEYCFRIGLADRFFRECCAKTVCTTFPPCQCGVEGICCALTPHYDDPAGGQGGWNPFIGQTLAMVTSMAGDPAQGYNGFPLHIVNLDSYQTTPPPVNQNWAPVPLAYTGPMTSADTTWDFRALGQIFGVTIDANGNIFVTASVCYSLDLGVTNTTGQQVMVFKIANGTGIVSHFATTADIPNSGVAMGNITYDCQHDQLFTTNMENGKIYRITGLANANGTVATDVYDPFGADNGAQGEAPLGERLWGIQWHADNRIYFGRWNKDSCHTSDFADYAGNTISRNEIWSVALDNTGKIDGTTLQKELDMPLLPNTTYSNPVSDIQFDKTGKMMAAERSMCDTTSPYSHQSRGIEFQCDAATMGWVPTGGANDLFHQVGAAVLPRGACGGTDYDFSTATSNAANAGRRVWFTGDIVGYHSNGGWIYGIKGIPLGGGNETNSIMVELLAYSKTSHGDVEIPCPPQGANVSVTLGDYVADPNNMGLTATVEDANGNNVLTKPVHLNAQSAFALRIPTDLPDGTYTLGVKGKCWLRRAVNIEIGHGGFDSVNVSLINGDVNDDNEVGPEDFSILTSVFGSRVGDANYLMTADLDGDGEVGPSDFAILSTNFGRSGD